MSLHGTFDTFALSDVLRLLASARKTGRLRVQGSRGTGGVWVEEGFVVAADAARLPAAARLVDVIFELLRFRDGAFEFVSSSTPSDAAGARTVEQVLAEAERLLAEWLEIEAVVPSMAARVRLADELEVREVLVTAEQWRLVAAIAGGASVADVADVLEASEVEASRAVKELVEAGLAVVDTAPTGADAPHSHVGLPLGLPTMALPAPHAPAVPDPVVAGVAPAEEEEDEPGHDGPEADDLSTAEELLAEMELISSAGLPVPIPAGSGFPLPADLEELEAFDDVEITGPVPVVAAHANPVDEVPAAPARPAPAAAVEDEDEDEDEIEPINRGALLKFLSAVRG